MPVKTRAQRKRELIVFEPRAYLDNPYKSALKSGCDIIKFGYILKGKSQSNMKIIFVVASFLKLEKIRSLLVDLDLPAKSQESPFTDVANTELQQTRLVSSPNVSVPLDFWNTMLPMAESTRNLRVCPSYDHDFYSDSTPSPPPSTPEERAINSATQNHNSRLEERDLLQQELDKLVNLPLYTILQA